MTPDKRYIAAAGNPHIRLYEINSANPNPVTTFDGHKDNVTAIGFQRDRRWMYSASEDGTVKVWDLLTSGCQREYVVPGGVPINPAIIHPNQGEIILGDSAGVLRVWDLTSGQCTRKIEPERDVAITSVSVAADARTATAATSTGNLYIWDLSSDGDGATEFSALDKIEAHAGHHILTCRISPDCGFVATTSADRTCKIWSLSERSLVRTLAGHTQWVWDAVFSADSAYIVTASSDCVARLWDLQSGESIRQYSGHHKAVVAVALNDTPTTTAT